MSKMDEIRQRYDLTAKKSIAVYITLAVLNFYGGDIAMGISNLFIVAF
jgi:hypothetical protein